MKKLFSTLGMMALVSLCLFTSCKDEDVPGKTEVNKDDVTAALNQAQQNAQKAIIADAQANNATAVVQADGTVKVTNADQTYSVTSVQSSYTYTVVANGKTTTCRTEDQLQATLANLPAGTTATITAVLSQTTTTTEYDKNGKEVNKEKETEQSDPVTSTVKIPDAGNASTETIKLPTNVDGKDTAEVQVTIVVNEKGQHSGGGIN